jgi:hypothetical protein
LLIVIALKPELSDNNKQILTLTKETYWLIYCNTDKKSSENLLKKVNNAANGINVFLRSFTIK